MRILLLILIFALSPVTFAEESNGPPTFDLAAICGDKPIQHDLLIFDDGFCPAFLEHEAEAAAQKSVVALGKLNPSATPCEPLGHFETKPNETKSRWKIKLYMSNSFTTYFNSKMTFSSSRYQLEVKDYQWAERSSREFFSPKTWMESGHNPFQIFDEPTNTFTASIEKDGNEFFISAFHPKFLQAEGQSPYMKGTIDGVAVDGRQTLNTPFHGYVQVPGESKIVRNQFTWQQMDIEAGYGKHINLLENKRLGTLTYVPSIGAGIMIGRNYTAAVKEGAWWDYDTKDSGYGVNGFGGSVKNRIEWNMPRDRFGLFYENKLGIYHMEAPFLDGTQKFDLKLMGNSFGLKFNVYDPNKKRKVPKDL